MRGRKQLPDLDLVRSLVQYDEETGLLFWHARPVEMFLAPRHAAMWNRRFAGKGAFDTKHHAGYLYGALFGSNYSTHRIAWYLKHGVTPDEIDHINGDRSDNRLVNLREVSRAGNCRNQQKTRRNRSGVAGVCWDAVNARWHVRVGSKHIGRFKDFNEAVAARKAAAAEDDFHPNHGR